MIPPLVVTAEQIDEGLALWTKALRTTLPVLTPATGTQALSVAHDGHCLALECRERSAAPGVANLSARVSGPRAGRGHAGLLVGPRPAASPSSRRRTTAASTARCAGHGTAGDTTTALLSTPGCRPGAMVRTPSGSASTCPSVHGCRAQPRSLRPRRGPGRAGRKRGAAVALPMVVHPWLWTRKRLAVPDSEVLELPTLNKRALDGEGFKVARAPRAVAPGGRQRADHRQRSTAPPSSSAECRRSTRRGQARLGEPARSSQTNRRSSCMSRDCGLVRC